MKYIENVTGKGKFPLPQTLAYKEQDKGNQPDLIKKNPVKYKGYILIKPGEKIETNLNGENVYGEPRLHFVNEGKKGGK